MSRIRCKIVEYDSRPDDAFINVRGSVFFYPKKLIDVVGGEASIPALKVTSFSDKVFNVEIQSFGYIYVYDHDIIPDYNVKKVAAMCCKANGGYSYLVDPSHRHWDARVVMTSPETLASILESIISFGINSVII